MDLMTILLLIIILFPMLNYWIFDEAGVGGYKALIPFYNYYIWLKVIGKPWWWLITHAGSVHQLFYDHADACANML